MDDMRFTSFSILMLFLSYQDNERVIMRSCVQLSPVNSWKDFNLQRKILPGTVRSVSQRLANSATGAHAGARMNVNNTKHGWKQITWMLEYFLFLWYLLFVTSNAAITLAAHGKNRMK